MFAMHSHIFGEVMDIEPDQLSGRRTTATLIGRARSKFLIAAFLSIATILVQTYFRDWIITRSLAFAALWFVIHATSPCRNRPSPPKQTLLCFPVRNTAP